MLSRLSALHIFVFLPCRNIVSLLCSQRISCTAKQSLSLYSWAILGVYYHSFGKRLIRIIFVVIRVECSVVGPRHWRMLQYWPCMGELAGGRIIFLFLFFFWGGHNMFWSISVVAQAFVEVICSRRLLFQEVSRCVANRDRLASEYGVVSILRAAFGWAKHSASIRERACCCREFTRGVNFCSLL